MGETERKARPINLSSPSRIRFWESFGLAFQSVLGTTEGIFKLPEIARAMDINQGDLRDCVEAFRARGSIPEKIAELIEPKVDALILAHTSCDMEKSGHESISVHTSRAERTQMLDIARLEDDRLPADRAHRVLETVQELTGKAKLLFDGEPLLLSTQPDLAVRSVRRLLAAVETSYALMIPGDRCFERIELDLDGGDYWRGRIDVATVFALETSRRDNEKLQVIPMRDLTDDTNRIHITEYLVRTTTEDGDRFSIYRPSVAPRTPPQAIRTRPAIAAAARAVMLPGQPLADAYGANRFDHPKPATWEAIMMIVAWGQARGLSPRSANPPSGELA